MILNICKSSLLPVWELIIVDRFSQRNAYSRWLLASLFDVVILFFELNMLSTYLTRLKYIYRVKFNIAWTRIQMRLNYLHAKLYYITGIFILVWQNWNQNHCLLQNIIWNETKILFLFFVKVVMINWFDVCWTSNGIITCIIRTKTYFNKTTNTILMFCMVGRRIATRKQ